MWYVRTCSNAVAIQKLVQLVLAFHSNGREFRTENVVVVKLRRRFLSRTISINNAKREKLGIVLDGGTRRHEWNVQGVAADLFPRSVHYHSSTFVEWPGRLCVDDFCVTARPSNSSVVSVTRLRVKHMISRVLIFQRPVEWKYRRTDTRLKDWQLI